MRALVRWSDSSLTKTTLSPRQGEPSRRIAQPSLCRLALEVAVVDRIQARLLDRDAQQPTAAVDHRRSALGAYVGFGEQPHPSRRGLLHRTNAGHGREFFLESVALRLDVDRIAAAEHLASELSHRADQRDVSRLEQRDAVADALHPVEQV